MIKIWIARIKYILSGITLALCGFSLFHLVDFYVHLTIAFSAITLIFSGIHELLNERRFTGISTTAVASMILIFIVFKSLL
ncbi:hypothetical protein [Paenibacillus alba]|uniref:DUF3953 domain-containing protein n=1 Tax=Paenibacillus alba TaxID=1197127 RepID=A0ABU6GDN2_9BACL|nr:hypothetical protein [Paenibacillus alba]MEC0232311.1 hypothetical protein [Paenibacillus alba]